MSLTFKNIGVIGAGTMGAGIAQVAAQSGCSVKLFDAREGAAVSAIERTGTTLTALAAKGKLTAEAATATIARITAAPDLAEFHDCDLVIEIDEVLLPRIVLSAQMFSSDLNRACFAARSSMIASITKSQS